MTAVRGGAQRIETAHPVGFPVAVESGRVGRSPEAVA
jgi:uncharacterized protein YwbE